MYLRYMRDEDEKQTVANIILNAIQNGEDVISIPQGIILSQSDLDEIKTIVQNKLGA